MARDQGFGTAIIFDPCSAIEPADLGVVVHLDGRFGYLAAGDVIAFDPGSRRFRVLFRRTSKHNSFLVTERCNHYCLMGRPDPPHSSGIVSPLQTLGLLIPDWRISRHSADMSS
jgi:hypothetical protein